MNLTPQQNEFLKQHLGNILKYRETYNEVYDHVISALASKQEITPFEQTVNELLLADFGGYNNLPRLEKAARKYASKEIFNKFLHYLAQLFHFPTLLYIITGLWAAYYSLSSLPFGTWYLPFLCIIALAVPALFALSGSAKIYSRLNLNYKETGKVFNHTQIKRSLKDDILNKLNALPFFVFLLAQIILREIQPVRAASLNIYSALFLTPLLTGLFLYSIALRKLYLDEFLPGILQLINIKQA